MTSMPASRSARAMIFAPRSCPSRPGFATTTRIFPAIAPEATSSEDGGLAPGAPDLAQRVAHLAHRDVRARRLHDRLHEVAAVVGRVLLQPRDRGLRSRRVASPPHRLDTFDLLLLERRIDAEDLDRLLLLHLVAVHSDDDPLAALDLGLVAEARLGDLALHEVLLDRRDHAAELVDPLEVVVRLTLELVRELLEVVGAAERVDRVHDAGLVRDHLLRTQRESRGVLGRQCERLVEAVRV